ncbi:hypothetical protein HK098_005578 [Nowakowskiella sp. JEL0407]|nr:hypothetical protein HK098_005578 [Nowakowskiella sp. JEL0407]
MGGGVEDARRAVMEKERVEVKKRAESEDRDSELSGFVLRITSVGYDKSTQAIVLRVDSGGGGAIASDTIWESVLGTQQLGKPVIVSFGNVAASGGYYLAAASSCIIANPGTVTGSIGVAMMRPKVMEKLFVKNGDDF